ncbi:MAG: M1 family metallopeptidase [Candidatus Eremiobacteraeota bacterium]|nr:M1 family metallopeptidase [Candidatus Eremiobacteraeota bacterium]MBC5828206.1 M1 family metallopeptidase [Candidatus Eremiobacteraeota bacterium]
MRHPWFSFMLSAFWLCAVFSSGNAASQTQAPQPIPYGRGRATLHTTAAAPYRFENQLIRLSFDFRRGIVNGETTSIIFPKRDGLAAVPFDSVGLHYSSVTVNGTAARYRVSPDKLSVILPSPAAASQRLTIVATYAAHPTRGVYFIRPDASYPALQPEIWSQGESEDNRRWYPTWDEPNEKSPTEIIATVPRDWRVVANGSLVGVTRVGSTSTWDWRESRPHSTYLTAFVAGPYVKLADSLGALPVDYNVSPQDARYGRLCFGRTPQMIAFFQSKIGIPFPWEKYDQTTVERFTAGGMENASATTQTETAIHPPAYDTVRPCDGLVSHELSHQWWGDDVTTPDWANIWINEGFATYFEQLWAGRHFGGDRFDYERYNSQHVYFDETKRYWRPIVDYRYASADDSFDASGYDRPGQVLHMLRIVLGDDAFWKALHDYLAAYQYKNADTAQFQAAIEKSSGRHLGWFFRQWFYTASYPHYYLTQRYSEAAKTLTLDVAQRNHLGVLFKMPVTIEVETARTTRTVRAMIDRASQRIQIRGVDGEPRMVLFDVDNNVLRQLDFRKSTAALTYQATHAASVPDRLWALNQLSTTTGAGKPAARAAVRAAVSTDSFYGVRADALAAAAALDDADSVRLALRDADPRVRIAAGQAVAGLQHARNAALIAALRGATRSSDAWTAGAAYQGLGATRVTGLYGAVLAGLSRPSYDAVVARGSIAGLGLLGDVRAVDPLETRARYGAPEAARPAAIAALAKIGHGRPQTVRPFLTQLALRDPYYRARRAAVAALGDLGSQAVLPALRTAERNDTEASVQDAAYDAIAAVDAATARKHPPAKRPAKKRTG